MSYSFRLPEEEPICECRRDEGRQRMDRDDCHFHCDLPEEPAEVGEIEECFLEEPYEANALNREQPRKDEDETERNRKGPRTIEPWAEAG